MHICKRYYTDSTAPLASLAEPTGRDEYQRPGSAHKVAALCCQCTFGQQTQG